MILVSFERDGVAYATSRGAVDAFVRIVSRPDRRILAIADGHDCGWTAGVESISGAVLHGIDHALGHDPSAPLEVLFDAAREQFLRAAEPYPEDEGVTGSPAAQLAVIELTRGRLRAGRLGFVRVLVVRDGLVRREADRGPQPLIQREPSVPTMVETDVLAGDLVIVSYKWLNDWGGERLPGVVEELVRACTEPREIVTAAITRWRDEVRQGQQAGGLIGEPQLTIAVTRA